MNYYSYYFPYNYPIKPKFSIKSLFNNVQIDSILNKTQKTLNIVNQAIPLIRQAKPVINNTKTMFNIMKEFKNIDLESNVKKSVKEKEISPNNPTFFQ